MARHGTLVAALVLGLLAVFGPLGALAQSAGGDDAEWIQICRRLYNAHGYLPARCRAQLATETHEAYCDRVVGTHAWTRRCASPTPTATFDPIAYCRRIYGTDEWTRRCLHLVDPTRTPEPTRERPTSTPEPTRERPTRTAEPTRERPTPTPVVVTVVATLRGEPATIQAPVRVRP